MRCLFKLMKTVWYANYESAAPMVDGDGYETGEKDVTYSDPVQLRINVSAARGTSDMEQFGNQLDYDKVLVTNDVNIPLTEESVMWIDTSPVIDGQGKTDTPWDYVVRRIARSVNYVQIAVKKVVVS